MAAMLTFLVGSKAGRVIGSALLICALASVIYHQIRRTAFEEAGQAFLERTVKVEQERKRDDAFLQDLENYSLCREYFGDRGVSDNKCRQLRRLY